MKYAIGIIFGAFLLGLGIDLGYETIKATGTAILWVSGIIASWKALT